MLANNFFDSSDFSLDIIPSLIGKIFCYETTEPFIDIGTQKNYEQANKIKIF